MKLIYNTDPHTVSVYFEYDEELCIQRINVWWNHTTIKAGPEWIALMLMHDAWGYAGMTFAVFSFTNASLSLSGGHKFGRKTPVLYQLFPSLVQCGQRGDTPAWWNCVEIQISTHKQFTQSRRSNHCRPRRRSLDRRLITLSHHGKKKPTGLT